MGGKCVAPIVAAPVEAEAAAVGCGVDAADLEEAKMTPLQNEPKQHQREAKHRTCRMWRTPDPNPDSASA
jgi:hypothetical protein